MQEKQKRSYRKGLQRGPTRKKVEPTKNTWDRFNMVAYLEYQNHFKKIKKKRLLEELKDDYY